MMKEISMHIMDIIENSVKAEARDIKVEIIESETENIFSLYVEDNGCGMSLDMLEKVRDPFTTSRTTRKVGLGIPMLEQTCIQCNGGLYLESTPGKGTVLKAHMEYNNIDRPPMGDIINSLYLLLIMHPETDFLYIHRFNENEFILDTKEIKEIIDPMPLNDPEIGEWLKSFIEEGIESLKQPAD